MSLLIYWSSIPAVVSVPGQRVSMVMGMHGTLLQHHRVPQMDHRCTLVENMS